MKNLDVDPPSYDCVVTGQVKMPVSAVVTQASDGRQLRWLLLLTVTCLGVVLLMTPACNLMKLAMMSRRHGTASDIISIETKLRDTDGVEGTQQLISSVIGNYVTYHVMKSSEQMWILDDFDHHVHVMKVQTPDEVVCYVTALNHSRATSPHAYAARNTDKSYEVGGRIQTVLIAADLPVTDRQFLGERGIELCNKVPVFSAYRLDAGHEHHHSRSKRHVKKCIMSCCHLVCCCNQKYYQWHSDDNFNCEHVCHGCSPASNTNVDRKC